MERQSRADISGPRSEVSARLVASCIFMRMALPLLFGSVDIDSTQVIHGSIMSGGSCTEMGSADSSVGPRADESSVGGGTFPSVKAVYVAICDWRCVTCAVVNGPGTAFELFDAT